MAVVLKRPQRGLLPVGNLKIDWSHPLANGLVGCWLPGISPIDLTGNCPPLTLTQNSGAQAPLNLGAEGPLLTGAVSGAGGNVLTCLAPPAFKNWNNFSLYYRGPRGTGNGVSNCYFVYVAYSNGVSSPFDVVSIGDLDSNDLTSVQIGWNDGSGEKKSGVPISFAAQTLISALGTFTVGGNNILYKNGLQVSSTAWSNSTQSLTSSTDTININGWQATGRYTPTSCNIACAWNRTLSDAEAAMLDADPYGFLMPAEGEMPSIFLPAAGGSFLAAWARNSNLPVIGTGNY